MLRTPAERKKRRLRCKSSSASMRVGIRSMRTCAVSADFGPKACEIDRVVSTGGVAKLRMNQAGIANAAAVGIRGRELGRRVQWEEWDVARIRSCVRRGNDSFVAKIWFENLKAF